MTNITTTPNLTGEARGVALAPIRWPGSRSLDRDIAAEKAATLLRKGLSPKDVCARLAISRSTLSALGHDYDFRVPSYEPGNWPAKDEPGEADVRYDRRYEAWARARRGAAHQLRKIPAPLWPEQPEPVFYDHCEATVRAVPLTGAIVIKEVCRKHRISKEALLGPLRRRELCAARHEAAFRMIVELGFSYPLAGRMLGGRDHTTILNSVRRHASSDPAAMLAFAAFINRVAATEEQQRVEVIRMHFDQGISVNTLSKRLSISRIKLMGWLIAEADLRAMRQAA